MISTLPYATNHISAVAGTIKASYEDFVVEEIPAYEPSGQGDHVYFGLEKSGLSTARAVRDIARALGIAPRDIGYAGLKDARAVTRQTMSIEHIDPAAVEGLSVPRMRVLWVSRHRNKLKGGHLRGNRFVVRMRDVDTSRLADVRACLELMAEAGAPNYYGEQRFGARKDTGLIGKSLVLGDFDTAAGLIAGSPGGLDHGRVKEGRELFEQGRFDEAARAFPRGYDECSMLARNMARNKGEARRSVLGLDKRALGLYVSAFQSELFNELLARRVDRLRILEGGDVAVKHENGAMFLVEELAAEQPRADRFEISATGPLYGGRLKKATLEVGAREHALLVAQGLCLADLPDHGPLCCKGGRRSFRMPVTSPTVAAGTDEKGEYLELSFSLESGGYATTVLREIGKDLLRSGEEPSSVEGEVGEEGP
ncbi:MAG: tRNA pseudouridine(13) synthase TruD [Myxococcota bacterium]|jgi:tRNA pseudouridine13 synthase|nr:tRNA pseudouridine(13) synthase TruD [Myxococcota bacterium]